MGQLGSCEHTALRYEGMKVVEGVTQSKDGRKERGQTRDVSFVRLDIIINTGLFNCDAAAAAQAQAKVVAMV